MKTFLQAGFNNGLTLSLFNSEPVHLFNNIYRSLFLFVEEVSGVNADNAHQEKEDGEADREEEDDGGVPRGGSLAEEEDPQGIEAQDDGEERKGEAEPYAQVKRGVGKGGDGLGGQAGELKEGIFCFSGHSVGGVITQ